MTMSGEWTLESSPITFNEFGIGLLTDQAVAHLITPDFLVINRIVPEDWVVNYPVIANRGRAEIGYENGLVVKAEAGEVGFIYAGEDVAPSVGLVCAGVAERFVRMMFGLGYVGVRFDTYGFIMLPEGMYGVHNIGSPLEGVLPVIGHEARYNLEGGLTVEFFAREDSRFDERFIDCVNFRALSTYVPEDETPLAGREWVQEIVSGWEEPLYQFVDLVEGFWGSHIDTTGE